MNEIDDDMLSRRLDAMGRALMNDAGPAPAALVAASRAMAHQRAAWWSYMGMAMAACLLLGFGGLAIWTATRTGGPTKLPGNRDGVVAQEGPEAGDAANTAAKQGKGGGSGVAQSGNGSSDTGVPSMGDLRGAVNDPTAGDPRVGGSLSPKY